MTEQMGFDSMKAPEGDENGDASAGNQGSAVPGAGELHIPPMVQHYVDMWPRYASLMRISARVVRDLQAREEELGEVVRTAWKWNPMGHDTIEEFARHAIGALTCYARQVLCYGDDRIFTHTAAEDIVEETGCLKNPECPDFLGYWRALHERFGGGASRKRGQELAAGRLRESLRIYNDDSNVDRHNYRRKPKIERGGVTFDLGSTWVRKHHSSGYEIHYERRNAAAALLSDLRTVLGPAAVSSSHDWSLLASHIRFERLPARIEAAGWRWTLLKDDSYLWMPQETAMELRARLDDLAPGL